MYAYSYCSYCKRPSLDCTAAAPTNGAVTSTTVIHAQTTTYSCTTSGYTLIGTATQTCTSGSLSAAAPTCEQGTKLKKICFANILLLIYLIDCVFRHLFCLKIFFHI